MVCQVAVKVTDSLGGVVFGRLVLHLLVEGLYENEGPVYEGDGGVEGDYADHDGV